MDIENSLIAEVSNEIARHILKNRKFAQEY
jgi:hypothetical protein